MADTPHPMTDADLVVTLRSPHYDSWVCRLAATRMEELEQRYERLLKQVEEELGVGLFVKVLTMTDRDLLGEVKELSIRGVLADVEETLAGWRRYEDAERPVPRDSPAANADEPEWLRDKLRVLVTRCREIEAERDRLKAELSRLRESIGVCGATAPGSTDIADYIALRDRGDTLKGERDRAEAIVAQFAVFVQHERAVRDGIAAGGMSVGDAPRIPPSVLRECERMISFAPDIATRYVRVEAELARAQKELALVTDTLREAVEDCADQRRRAERLEERLEHLRHAAELALGFPGPDGGPQTDSQLIGELTAQLAQHEQDIDAAARRGWNAGVYSVHNGDRIDGSDDVDDFVARYKEEREKGGTK